MADKPFDREVINPRERPLGSDLNREAAYAEMAIRAAIAAFTTPRTSASSDAPVNPYSGFFGEGFRVRPPAGGSPSVLPIAPGIGFWGEGVDAQSDIGGVAGVNDPMGFKPLVLSQTENINIVNNASPNSRIDLIEVRPRRELIDPTSRAVFDAGAGVFLPGAVNKTFTWEMGGQQGTVTEPANSTACIGYKVGIPAVVPTVPPTTPGYVPVAVFRVLAGAPGFTDPDQLEDRRRILMPYGLKRVIGVVQVDPDNVPVPSLLEFHTPPGFHAPKFILTAPVVNDQLQLTIRLFSAELATAALAAGQRVTWDVELLSGSDDQYPIIIGRSLTVIGTNETRLTVRCIKLNILAGVLQTALAPWPAGTLVNLRFSVTYW